MRDVGTCVFTGARVLQGAIFTYKNKILTLNKQKNKYIYHVFLIKTQNM